MGLVRICSDIGECGCTRHPGPSCQIVMRRFLTRIAAMGEISRRVIWSTEKAKLDRIPHITLTWRDNSVLNGEETLDFILTLKVFLEMERRIEEG